MKTLNQYIQEKLIINKDYHDNMIVVKSFNELRKIIEDRYKKLGPGTEQDPVDFNDIDVSNLDSFCNDDVGIFEETKFKYIDISAWDVSNVKSMRYMFFSCKELKSVVDISGWNVSNVTNMNHMFFRCKSFNQDISKWDVSSITDMNGMFCGCKSFNQDLSSWDVSSVTDMSHMFQDCKNFNKDIHDWDVSNVKHFKHRSFMFDNCPIKDEYKPKFK